MRKRILTLALLISITAGAAGCGASEPLTEPVTKTEAESAAETKVEEIDDQSSDGVSPEFKEAMDSYEAFFDEYVKFMKKFSESKDALSMMGDYTDYMTKYADIMEKMGGIDADNLSTAEYAYYIDVMARIEKRLLEAAGM